MRPLQAVASLVAAMLAAGAAGSGFDFDDAPIDYHETAPDDAVAALQRRIDAGETVLRFKPHFGYLPALLRELEVPVWSQVLVFSKTSLQVSLISPTSPRAIYFNDDVYVGWVPGGSIEVSAVDPRLGANFYLLTQERSPRPKIMRHHDECLQCHGSSMTRGVPGHVVRSVTAGPDGHLLADGRSFLTDHSSPLSERWGGWYVTGEHGRQRHLGNTFGGPGGLPADPGAGANVTDVGDRFNPRLHLAPHSDIVALMVLEHQVTTHNALAHAAFAVRRAEHAAPAVAAADRRDVEAIVRDAAADVVRTLLLADEPQLTDPIVGTSDFTREFPRAGPRDARGRSLRDFDLRTRLFRHPCSFLVYSRAFRQLPPRLKVEVERQLWAALDPDATGGPAGRLAADERAAIRDILVETLPDAPARWRAMAR